MENQYNSPNKRHRRYNDFEAQMEIVYKSFYEYPKTMLMVSEETGICRSNICRFVGDWRRNNNIDVVKKDSCKISNYIAGYLVTDPSLFHKTTQLRLF